MVLANVATKVLGFAAVAYVTRHTTAQDFGVFSYLGGAEFCSVFDVMVLGEMLWVVYVNH